MLPQRKYPMTFRQEEVKQFMAYWKSATSCSLVGTGSVGKSNLIQHMMTPEVLDTYATEIHNKSAFKPILIDANLMIPLSETDARSENMQCWAGYELLMHRLYMTFYPFDLMDNTSATHFHEAYQALQDGTNPHFSYLGLRYLEFGLELLIKNGAQIIFIFDEFEELLRTLPVKFFISMRGLRDRYKSSLSFMTCSRLPLNDLVTKMGIDKLAIEPFVELFSDSVVFVGPYNTADARDMLTLLMKRSNKSYTEDTLRFLMWATGSHAGLLRSSFASLDLLDTHNQSDYWERSAQLIQQLAIKSKVRAECAVLWGSLSENEQTLMRKLALKQKWEVKGEVENLEVQEAFALLAKRRLLHILDNDLIIEPPLFRVYLETFILK